MKELQRYTSFEDLKKSQPSSEPTLTKSAAEVKDKEYIEFIELARSCMEPSRPKVKSNAK